MHYEYHNYVTGQVGQTHSLEMLDSILRVDITLLDVFFTKSDQTLT